MREKLQPWIPAMFAASLCAITMVGNLTVAFISKTPGGLGSAMDPVFYANLPMCFYFVGAYLSKLRKENQELRAQLAAITNPTQAN